MPDISYKFDYLKFIYCFSMPSGFTIFITILRALILVMHLVQYSNETI